MNSCSWVTLDVASRVKAPSAVFEQVDLPTHQLVCREAAVQVNQELCSFSETVIALQAVCPHMQYIVKTDGTVSFV